MVEAIPPADLVSRLIDSPHKWTPSEQQFVDATIFEFPSPDLVESLVWRKYKPNISDVHELGCTRQATKRPQKPNWTYEGALSVAVAAIRGITSAAGDRFYVVHEPEEGQYHAHVGCEFTADTVGRKQRKADLREHLRAAFKAMPFERHTCA